jgi:hypothetical protein
MNDNIYTNDELFDTSVSLDKVYDLIKQGDCEQITHLKCVKEVYECDPITYDKYLIGWLLSPYHYVKRDDPDGLYFTMSLSFSKDEDNDIILDPHQVLYWHQLYDTSFRVDVIDANCHDYLPDRIEHWLHKAGLDGFPLHVLASCDCHSSVCPYDQQEFYYNDRESFDLLPLTDKISFIKVYLNIYIDKT